MNNTEEQKQKKKNKSYPRNARPKKDKKVQFSIYYVMFAILSLFVFDTFFMKTQVEHVPYSQFKQFLKEGRVLRCVLSSESIEGIYFPGESNELDNIRSDLQNFRIENQPEKNKIFLNHLWICRWKKIHNLKINYVYLNLTG